MHSALFTTKNGQIKNASIKKKQTIYDGVMDSTGETLPHGCLAGSCGACKILVTKGEENLVAPGAIEKNTLQALEETLIKKMGTQWKNKGILRLSCRAKTQGDISFEIAPSTEDIPK